MFSKIWGNRGSTNGDGLRRKKWNFVFLNNDRNTIKSKDERQGIKVKTLTGVRE